MTRGTHGDCAGHSQCSSAGEEAGAGDAAAIRKPGLLTATAGGRAQPGSHSHGPVQQ